jgi:2-keto-4-pentenoate hydratase/2-oxohepta-3-ene-1,7-dioic acid hydratase in catechol pathway
MRLISHRVDHGTRLAVVLADGTAIDTSALGSDLPSTMADLIDGGDAPLESLRRAVLGARPGGGAPIDSLDLAAPLGRIGKLIAVGKNYVDHATEEGVAPPAEPLLFAKFPSAVIGHDDPIVWRLSDTTKVDWEAELAVVIGRPGRDVPRAGALDLVLGYTCLNDVSARDLQFGDGQWVRGKSLDTFCPVGPWLVTADEVPDPGTLRIRCLVDGEVVQDASTAEMIHDVPALIAYCSRFMTLLPGDVIATGTPAGIGAFRDPPRYLSDGQEVIVDIEGVGRLRNVCRVLPGRP